MSTQIDWNEQWAIHAPNFQGGLAHVSLPNGEEFCLCPGPGFGDFSHPTTKLMIEMMVDQVEKKEVFDIGCGSGILSIASIKLGASQVKSVDIDPEAMAHTKKNAALNQISNTPFLQKNPVVLMNMIASEQKIAWQEHRCSFHRLLTSGVLLSEKKRYLEFAKAQGWDLVQDRSLFDWVGFIFKEIV